MLISSHLTESVTRQAPCTSWYTLFQPSGVHHTEYLPGTYHTVTNFILLTFNFPTKFGIVNQLEAVF